MLFLTVALAALIVTSATATDATAQTYNNGYGFGTGIGQSFGARRSFARPPYFAEFPPVYYSGIVRRPYGISPYAAPAGIAPVELSQPVVHAQRITIKNPFFNKSIPAKAPAAPKANHDNLDNKTTWIKNPYFVKQPTQIEVEFEAILSQSHTVAKSVLNAALQLALLK